MGEGMNSLGTKIADLLTKLETAAPSVVASARQYVLVDAFQCLAWALLFAGAGICFWRIRARVGIADFQRTGYWDTDDRMIRFGLALVVFGAAVLACVFLTTATNDLFAPDFMVVRNLAGLSQP
jgi:hypothetical protein